MCEKRDLCIKWPQWHTLTFERQVQVDMRHVCKENEKKMLIKQARSTYWRKQAAKHEYEDLKEGICLEPALTLLRRKTKEEWTDKHRHVARKLVLEGGCVQKRLFRGGSGKFVKFLRLFGRLSLNSLALQCRPTLRDLTCFGHRTYMLAIVTGSGARCAWHHDVSQTSLSDFHQHVYTWLIVLASRNGAAL